MAQLPMNIRTSLSKTLARIRTLQLAHELRAVEKRFVAFNSDDRLKLARAMFREFKAAQACEQPHLYMSDNDQSGRQWGQGTRIARQRMASSNHQVQISGVGLWLAIVYHETRDAKASSSLMVHRRVMTMARQLRELIESDLRPRESSSIMSRITNSTGKSNGQQAA